MPKRSRRPPLDSFTVAAPSSAWSNRVDDPTWEQVLSRWRLALRDLDIEPPQEFHFTDVPTDLVDSPEPPRLDWWPFPPWPNPTSLARLHGLGMRHGPGSQDTLHMLLDVAADAEAVAGVLLGASIVQLHAYWPAAWRGSAFQTLLKLTSVTQNRIAHRRWFGTTKRTLPLQLFHGATQWVAPGNALELTSLIAFEHALLLNGYHAVRAVPLDSVAISPKS